MNNHARRSSGPENRTLVLCIVTLIGLLPIGGRVVAAETRITLVESGKPAAVIVLPARAERRSVEYQAADLLANMIERMTGTRLDVTREDQLTKDTQRAKNLVVIGEGPLASRLGVNAEGLGPGGIRLKTGNNAVVLVGGPASLPGEPGSDSGSVVYAAIELLERLGCHYLWPGELGMVIPNRATVVVEPVDVRYTPAIRRRYVRWAQVAGQPRADAGLERLAMTTDQWQAGLERAMGDEPPISWTAWQRLGGQMPTFGHAGGGLRSGTAYLTIKPEWFALQADGTRDQAGDARWRLCKSNPELIDHVARDIIAQLHENPGTQLVSLDPNDGGSRTGWCLCENCRALDPPHAPKIQLTTYPTADRRERRPVEHPALTDRLVWYWNSIAARVVKEHPDVLFGVSAYGPFSHPPVKQKLHPNLLVRYVPSHTEFVPAWTEAGARRMYWRPNILLVNRRDGKLRSIVGPLAENMRYFADAGIVQTDFDSIGHNWATLGVSYYAAARLNWNPYLPAEQIIADFARHGFGQGAEHIEKYLQRIEQLTAAGVAGAFQSGDDRRYSPEVLSELRELLNDGEQAADDPVIARRIAFLRMGLNFTELQEKLDELSWRASQGEDVDRELARRLVDLNSLALRDIMLNHNLAVNVPNLVWATGGFARFAAIRGRTVSPSDAALLDRVADPRYGLTGREDSLAEMLSSFGL
jgi:hypothetical protein